MKRLLFKISSFFLFCGVLFPQSKVTTYNIVDAFPHLLNFSSPLDFQNAKDGSGRVFVVERGGTIVTFAAKETVHTKKVFLDISSRVISGSELGLLGLAFHPHYAQNGYFYVDYTAPDSLRTVIARYRVSANDPDVADPSSEKILLEIPQPFQNHKGGQLRFGPDGYLYIGMGDGGDAGDPFFNGQNRSVLLGKILRINVDSEALPLHYAIPPDNPFAGNTQGFREEIFAYGLRNPWRFSFDSISNLLYCGDVGQNAHEEVDIIENGKNYGWNTMEGVACYGDPHCVQTGITLPIKDYINSKSSCAVIGGFVYRGKKVPSLYGAYVYGDYCGGKIFSFRYNGTTITNDKLLVYALHKISSLGVDEMNELYFLSLNNGRIYKLYPEVIPSPETYRTFSQQQFSALKGKKNKKTFDSCDVRDTIFKREYAKGLTLGVAQAGKDSIMKYGWITFKKSTDMKKFFMQTGKSYFFDSIRTSSRPKVFVRYIGNPVPAKYNNHLAGELAMFSLNLTASKRTITKAHFGDLIYNDSASVFNTMSLNSIKKFADSAMTYWRRFQTRVIPDSLDSLLTRLNRSFLAPITEDDFICTKPLIVEGRITLNNVSFLKEPDSSFKETVFSETQFSDEMPVAENYPNPFNSSTIIQFSIPFARVEANGISLVSLFVYDILGKQVASLLHNTPVTQGEHEVEFNAQNLPSGVYYYRVSVSGFSVTKKLVLLK